MTVSCCSPEELGSVIRSGSAADIIDVRTPKEFQEVHLATARNMPLDRLDPQTVLSAKTKADQPLYVICKSGGRSRMACEKLIAAGITNVINVDGGTQACVAAGLEVVRGAKAISLERQVRIAAGSLVLLGAGLSLLHPAWIGLSAFVGAGLVFAGITDTCGMGMILARMPWNQTAPSASCSIQSR